ncbi:hypothetical protein Ait01nite_042300 [Actinoplanes italicus]|uniref:Putative NAD-dependent protein-ADP-ribosyltransferase YbiA (DUF1768 family) n=1 Tax=Actinoplanes italicus TaxID=113567 RepID=A0A2T0K1J6_9ACTN|nr:NADAR family protein [Actinoplanes italicus]PRX16686.1 putative NAD-dependent protein-ADP-ribosyltransferase YbiA (DUF1768 family) [Actinoplanes italicus]GIE31185.1 hypothetical protein Ait01nite_042300 [Actinoplanes italicus]
MIKQRRTYRVVDGERIEGTWRPVFIRNGAYHLTELYIFADGMINCWEWVDLGGLRRKLADGWVALDLEEGAEASAHDIGTWRFADPWSGSDAESFLAEVADEIDVLNNRPDSTGRCHQALDRFLASGTEDDRRALRAAYLAIPETVRLYALGDMDAKDRPLRLICTPVGGTTTYREVVTEADHAEAEQYFAERDRWRRKQEEARAADGPQDPRDPTVILDSYALRPSVTPGVEALRNEYPVPVDLGGLTFPTATHAYWALSTVDVEAREAIRDAKGAAEATAGRAPIRPGWAQLRDAVMHTVLRAKFGQNPDLAEILVGTGDARIEYHGFSRYWDGRLGRLLELVRSEIAAERSGF